MMPQPQHRRIASVGGGNYLYKLGELNVRLRDLDGYSRDLRIAAQLTRDNGVLTIPMVLGLNGGVIDGRILRSESDPAAPFAWTLKDPCSSACVE